MTTSECCKVLKEAPASYRVMPSSSWFTLIGTTFIVFEVFFLIFYGSDFWFQWSVSWFGLPILLLSLLISHVLLTWIESSSGCRFFFPIKKGMPFVVYRKWLSVDDSGIAHPPRAAIWAAGSSVRSATRKVSVVRDVSVRRSIARARASNSATRNGLTM